VGLLQTAEYASGGGSPFFADIDFVGGGSVAGWPENGSEHRLVAGRIWIAAGNNHRSRLHSLHPQFSEKSSFFNGLLGGIAGKIARDIMAFSVHLVLGGSVGGATGLQAQENTGQEEGKHRETERSFENHFHLFWFRWLSVKGCAQERLDKSSATMTRCVDWNSIA